MTLVSEVIGTVADFVERPGAPNLYWALTALPRPLIDLRGSEEWEYRMAEMQIPELLDLDRERTAEQWDGVLKRIRTYLWRMVVEDSEGGNPKYPAWFPKDRDPGEPAAKSPDLAAACKFVARCKGLPPEQVEAMPPAQVLLLNMMATYQQDRDDYFRAIYLPYPQCLPLLDAAHKRLSDAPAKEDSVLSRIFFPALPIVTAQQARIESNVAALRVIEALRMYAAHHDGRLPDDLHDVTEVFIPDDPSTGRPFEYTRQGGAATLVSHVPGDPLPSNGLRYRVSIRNK